MPFLYVTFLLFRFPPVITTFCRFLPVIALSAVVTLFWGPLEFDDVSNIAPTVLDPY